MCVSVCAYAQGSSVWWEGQPLRCWSNDKCKASFSTSPNLLQFTCHNKWQVRFLTSRNNTPFNHAIMLKSIFNELTRVWKLSKKFNKSQSGWPVFTSVAAMSIRYYKYFQMATSVCFQPDLSASPGREILFSLLTMFCWIPQPVADWALSHTKPSHVVLEGNQFSCPTITSLFSHYEKTWASHFRPHLLVVAAWRRVCEPSHTVDHSDGPNEFTISTDTSRLQSLDLQVAAENNLHQLLIIAAI